MKQAHQMKCLFHSEKGCSCRGLTLFMMRKNMGKILTIMLLVLSNHNKKSDQFANKCLKNYTQMQQSVHTFQNQNNKLVHYALSHLLVHTLPSLYACPTHTHKHGGIYYR